MKTKFTDGLKNLLSGLANRRNAANSNKVVSVKTPDTELRAIIKTGLGNKILRIKNGYALKDYLQFEYPVEEEFYKNKIAKHVKKAGYNMLGFGRSVVLVNEINADLSKPQRGKLGPYKLDVFGGDEVTAQGVSTDLSDPLYNKPKYYNVKGYNFHHSRVVDFSYVKPPNFDLPFYRYGGVSEFELIYNQIINDGVVERASASIIEKNSTLFYKIDGFKNLLQSKQESAVLDFFRMTEDARSMYGAGLIDAKDSVETHSQTLTNLADADQITLRRLAMVTGIPLAILVGESVRGLNSTGDTEKQVFNEMIETLQQDYYLDPINELLRKIGRSPVTYSQAQNITPKEKIEYESKAIENALKLWQMGEDFNEYLIDKGVIQKDDFLSTFSDEDC